MYLQCTKGDHISRFQIRDKLEIWLNLCSVLLKDGSVLSKFSQKCFKKKFKNFLYLYIVNNDNKY